MTLLSRKTLKVEVGNGAYVRLQMGDLSSDCVHLTTADVCWLRNALLVTIREAKDLAGA